MELREYLRILHKNWLLITASVLLGVIVAAAVSFLMPPTYEAKSQLYVSVRGEGGGTTELVQGSTFARQSVQSYVGVVTTDSVLVPVVDELGLQESPQQLAERVTASAPVDTSLLDIAVTGSDPARAAEIANAVSESLIEVVQGELEAFDGGGAASPVKLTTVQPARVPDAPIRPRIPLNLALGVILGLAVGVGIGVLRSILDTRIHSLRDIEQVTDAPLLGGITFDPDAKKRPLVVHVDPRSPRAESFRTLRTNVQFLAVNTEGRRRASSFVVSSAGPGEGKSTTTANLAIALAESGSRVMLIDGDLRKPRVAEYMGIEGGAGLTDVLIGRAEPTEVVQRWGRHQLFVMPSGKVPPNPSELLGSKSMERLLDQLTPLFDYILVDGPPLLLVTDAVVIAKRTQGAILVAASGSTRKPALEMAVRSLETAGASLRGMIVTMMPTKGPDSYGYGAYGYGGYGGEGAPEMSASTASIPIQPEAIRPATKARK